MHRECEAVREAVRAGPAGRSIPDAIASRLIMTEFGNDVA